MLNAKTGDVLKDYYIGGPLNVHVSIGATASGQMQVILPITAGLVSWGTGVPGDLVALSLQNLPPPATTTATTTAPGQTITTTVGGQTITTTVGGQTITTTVGGQTVTKTLGGQSVTTVTATMGGTGVDTTTLYGVAAVAVIFIIATGYLAMTRSKKPGS